MLYSIMANRPTAQARGYDSAWRKARAGYLAKHPFCVFCYQRGQRVMASHVDHIVPHKGDKSLFWDKTNWQSLCQGCHNGAKQSSEHTGLVRGCDSTGQPLDPNHHWAKA